jgi:serine/threonine-protein kinase
MRDRLRIELLPVAASAQTRGAKGPYGAIDSHAPTQSVGYTFDYAASRSAKVDALKQCGHEKCEVVVSLRSACGALATRDARFGAAGGATRAEAEAKATRTWGKDCEVVAWACMR